MIGTKYLSQLIDCSGLKKNSLNIVKAPTGSGKTYFALTHIPSLTDDPFHNVVYLIDTVNGKDQITRNYNAVPDNWKWIADASGDEMWFVPDNWKWIADASGDEMWFVPDDRVVIMTYAKFGIILERQPDFHTHFDYIICDELHNLPRFAKFTTQPNSHSLAKEGLERAVANDRSIVIALSATPNRIKEQFRSPSFIVPIDEDDLIRYETKEVVRYNNLDALLSSFDPAETGICYVSKIETMKALAEEAKEQGLSPIAIWSIRNTNHPMSVEQLEVRKTILETFNIPAKYNLLIINASAETSIKIKSPVDYVVVHSSNDDTQIQVRGRVNGDLQRIYLPTTTDTPLDVPDEFFGKRLFAEDRAKLCEALNVRNRNNRLVRWTTIHALLLNYDYHIEEGRYANKRYAIITPPHN